MQVYSRFRCISGLSPKQVASVIFRQFLRQARPGYGQYVDLLRLIRACYSPTGIVSHYCTILRQKSQPLSGNASSVSRNP